MKTLMRRTSLALAMAYSSAAIAQNPPVQQATGAIAGVVRDRYTRQPIEGAQVFIQGGAYGTSTKANGTYTILGVPVGTYTVVMRIVGYSPIEVENVVVRGDVRRELNMEMTSVDAQGQVHTEPAAAVLRAGTTTFVGSAQQTCPSSPGARFGVNGLQAASLSWRRSGTETVYSFQSEPVVIEVESWSALKPGDVILSVNGEPITTRGGADYFGNPPTGSDMVIAVRRNGERIEVNAPTCAAGETTRPSPARQGGGAGGVTVTSPGVVGGVVASPGSATTEPTRVRGTRGGAVRAGTQGGGSAGGGSAGSVAAGGITPTPAAPQRPVPIPADIVNDSLSEAVSLADFGVVLSCATACYRARDRAGTIYWRFIDPPVVRTLPLPNPRQMTDADWPVLDAIRRGRAAGLHEGVVIERVNGQAAASEAGSRILMFPAQHYPLNLDIRYGGRTQRITLKAPADGAR
ncbi:MAG TPA: carboxypeptidase regulatory-like domain-containing protein [Gemmatimonadaceae bacterium]|nr:carboxypeptidase regulatory-like domain-containing protein [Gemmatimonadaceae bacterium]